jgi:hypothetical protein
VPFSLADIHLNADTTIKEFLTQWTLFCFATDKFMLRTKYKPTRATLNGAFIWKWKVFSPEGGVGQTQAWLPTYVSILRIPQMMSLESDGGMILTGESRRPRRKTCHSATLSTTNPTWIDPGANPDQCGERPATNRLSYGTA